MPRISKKTVLLGSGALLVVVGLGIYGLIADRRTDITEGKGRSPADVLSASNQAVQVPAYNTILPQGKAIGELGGWGRVSPPDKEPVFAYVDKVADVQLTVSEQPLPATFKVNIAGEVDKLAKQFSANDKLNVGDGALAYVGTSHSGPQSIVAAKRDLLILIKSDTKLSNQQWVDYINSLR